MKTIKLAIKNTKYLQNFHVEHTKKVEIESR